MRSVNVGVCSGRRGTTTAQTRSPVRSSGVGSGLDHLPEVHDSVSQASVPGSSRATPASGLIRP